MFLALLAATDPCGHMERGETLVPYSSIAAATLQRLLRQRYHVADVVMLFPGDADAARALQFANAAVDWWETQCNALSRTTLVNAATASTIRL